MNKLKINYISIIIYCLLLSCTNTRHKKIEGTTLVFDKIIHDFGRLDWERGKTNAISFKYTNNGNAPLIINDIKTSCNCTIPNWSDEPLIPNESSQIKIVYDSKKLGRFNRTITVFYNGDSSPQKLIIKGEVVYHKINK
jgi:hypothetical protein